MLMILQHDIIWQICLLNFSGWFYHLLPKFNPWQSDINDCYGLVIAQTSASIRIQEVCILTSLIYLFVLSTHDSKTLISVNHAWPVLLLEKVSCKMNDLEAGCQRICTIHHLDNMSYWSIFHSQMLHHLKNMYIASLIRCHIALWRITWVPAVTVLN